MYVINALLTTCGNVLKKFANTCYERTMILDQGQEMRLRITGE